MELIFFGTVFKITPAGKFTTLHSFRGSDGSQPFAGLVQATDGDFYGTTQLGGASGAGTVFKITASGTLTTLYSFCAQSQCFDGIQPTAGLVQASDGNLYGTTPAGGTKNSGTVFQITIGKKLTTLHSFCSASGCADGASVWAKLVQGNDGILYGTTVGGGQPGGDGIVFKITTGGKLTVLHSFDKTDGLNPYGGLLQATNGGFYGTTFYGGNFTCNAVQGCGTIFSLDVGLGPFVSFVRSSRRGGKTAGILGQGFTGTTSVSFNGTPASFTVKSDTFLTATVPTTATSGYVTVTTPSGTLKSNVPFRIVP